MHHSGFDNTLAYSHPYRHHFICISLNEYHHILIQISLTLFQYQSWFQDFHYNDVRLSCVIQPGVWDKSWVSEINWFQPRHETAFWWRHNELVTPQLTDQIKWRNYPLELIGVDVHINTQQRIPDTNMS